MSYFINPVEEEKCVFLTHAARQEVGDLLAARQWNRMVVDITTLRSVPKAVELFALGGALAQGTPRNARIALVVRPDQARHARLVETVARNGGALLTFFTDAGKAEAWVRGDRRVEAQPSFHLLQQQVPQDPQPRQQPGERP